jgi:para-nitrobenzyl esterase
VPNIDETISRRTLLVQLAAFGVAAGPIGKAAAASEILGGATSRQGFKSFVAKAVPEPPIVSTNAGKVRGAVVEDIYVFKNIRYGEDTANYRFMAPVPAKPWTGVRDALEYGFRAPQPAARPSPNAPQATTPISEDCLSLNVWTPGLRDGGKRPVMVWFHGGGYAAGSGNSPGSDGTRLCKRGNVVVVAVNHRLNAFGFLYLAELGGSEFKDSGNVGMMDLVLSLKWVRDNIAEFGGDPDRVLIFGESGGGAKNATLMAMPSAHGLFQRACSSSGETVTASRPATATARSRAVLTALGLTPNTIQQIKTVPMAALVEASHATSYYGSVVDGGVLPRHPFDPDAPPISFAVPMLVGTNHDESRLLVGRGHPETFDLTWETLPGQLAKYADGMGTLDLNEVIAMYRKDDPNYTASEVFFRATTDSRDWRPALVEIERRAAQPKGAAPTYSYQLDWGSPTQPQMRACHSLDLPFLFDNVAISNALTGTGPEAYKLAEQMSSAYIAFAHTGNPNTPALPHWPAYDLAHRSTMTFNVECKVVDDPRSNPRKLFSTVHYENPGT